MRLFVLLAIVIAGRWAGAAEQWPSLVPFSPEMYKADENARWLYAVPEGVEMTDEFISPPRPGQDREAWLKALRTYREMVRAGGAAGMIQLNFDGVRTWTRLSLEASRDLALQPGDRVEARIEARWRQGNGEICAAFDRVDGSSGAWVGWTGVLASADTPRDDAWHTHTLRLEVPATELQNVLFRPIFGLDATHNATPGVVDIRDIALAKVAVPRRRDVPVAFPESAQGAEENQRPRGVYERAFPPLDRSSYDRPDLAWARGMFTCHFTFMYDRAFYDPERGYLVEAFLDDGAREFGGYDAVVLWQGYPRLGIDERNQFDMYRDMPGGMAGLHDMVRRFHARGVKVFIDYNPWDIGTRRPEKPDVDMLAELVAALDADGIFLDTLSAASPSLRAKVDAVRPGVVIAPEIHPPIDQLGVLNLSWAQWLNDPRPPGMLHLKWIEPRHLQHQIRRWHSSHREEIEIAFFNGSGMLVWENIFGSYNPWTEEDRALWRRCAPILRAFRANFTSDAWDPYYPTLQEGLYAHRWPAKTNSWDLPVVFTLRRVGEPVAGDAPAISIPASALPNGAEVQVFDLWAEKPARLERDGANGAVTVYAKVDSLGCIVLGSSALAERATWVAEVAGGSAQSVRDVREPSSALAERARTGSGLLFGVEGMVLIPGGKVRMRLTHQRRECGCYPDPGTPPEAWNKFLTGENFHLDLSHDFEVEVKPFFIDEAEVTNAEFKQFLDATGYRPKQAENFLKHWPGGEMPVELAEHPVVYVDLEDARTYAAWAGKRLPAEAEWHLAASGPDGLPWPWGNDFEAARVNTGAGTMPARSLPEGRSPFGCYHLCGNVWEWTEPRYDDGHTRFVMLRGGSFYKAEGSGWYTPGGPQPNTSHTKFLLMWPGLDRCGTIGFRCVRDT